jgi:hypothetical protein
MTAQDAFKVGYLRKCAELGMTKPQIAASFEKLAWLKDLLAGVGLGGNVATIAAATPIMAGMAGGYGVAKAINASNDSAAAEQLDDVVHDEKVDTYRQLAQRLRQTHELLKQKQAENVNRKPTFRY